MIKLLLKYPMARVRGFQNSRNSVHGTIFNTIAMFMFATIYKPELLS